jgi:hypothetical protein
MFAAFVLAASTAALSADEIFSRAQRAWEARLVPAYVSFDLPCDQTFLASHCPPKATAHFVVRMSDGRTYARTIPDAEPSGRILGYTLMQGGYIVGPASTPFGFYRRISADNVPSSIATPAPLPPNFAPDPLAPKLIAAVTVADRSYDVELASEERVGAHWCYHLKLRPLFAPEQHPLRDLWVDTASFEVIELAYARRASSDSAEGLVYYRFEPVGDNRLWTIVHIEAELPVAGKRPARPSSDLSTIAFPTDAPDWYFDASLPMGDPDGP